MPEYDLSNLWPVQLELWDAAMDPSVRNVFCVASTGEGKNLGIALCSVELAIMDQVTGLGNGVQLLGGQSVGAVDRNTRLYFQDVCKQYGIAFRAGRDGAMGPPCYLLEGGELAKILLAGGDNARSAPNIQGASVHHVFLDEATKLNPEFLSMASSRRRDDSGTELPTGKMFLTCNADNPFHPLRETYLEKAPGPGVRVIECSARENPYRSQERIEEMRAEGWPEHMIARLLDNVWAPADGLVYRIEPRMIVPEDVPYRPIGAVSMDQGIGGVTAALLWVERPWGHEIAAEYTYDADKNPPLTDEQHMDRLLDMWTITRFYPDPAAAGLSAAAMLRSIMPWSVDNTIDAGVHAARNALAQGWVRINRRCRGLLQDLSGLTYDPKTDKPRKTGNNHHRPDCFRYGSISMYPPQSGYIG